MVATPKLLLFTAALLLYSGHTISTNRCPNCGTTPVPYPLSTAMNCGDQSYKLRCDSNTLKFDTINSSYIVTSISPSNQRFVIQPSKLLPNTCVTADLPSQGIQLNDTLPFNVTGSNTIMFMNCTDSLLRSPLNCSATSLCHRYINSSSETMSCDEASSSICCTFVASGSTTSYSIRVREAGCSAYTSFVDLRLNSSENRWPEPGVEIQWAVPPEPVCESQADCDNGSSGNATCRPDPDNVGVSRCFCHSGLLWDPVEGICIQNVTCDNSSGCDGSTNWTPLIAGLTCGIGATVITGTIAMLLYKRYIRVKRSQERVTREREAILKANGGGKAAKLFTGREIKNATNNFSKDRVLGAGGYGEVYKGILDDGTIVAVKCAKLGNPKGTDQVLNEVRILCQVNHRSLVGLLGCCVELQQPMLVYEYIENGDLSEHLRGFKLTWIRRLRIAHDTADALAYLHSSTTPPIYHRDVKPSNILLDAKMNAKVSDFGLSRLACTDLSHISTCAQGTLGYLDPEYYRNYQLTDKSDVYSFGVVLLELLTSQRAIDFNREADDVNLAVYVRRMVDEERFLHVVDPMIKVNASVLELETMKALGFLAVSCLEERRQNRPSMKEVAEEIAYIMTIATAKEVDH